MTAPSPQPDRPAASIVIPHYNDLENLATCLAALRRQTVANARFEIVVADNNSACNRADLARICAAYAATLISAPIPGAAEARNAGVRAARGQVLAFIDSDCRPSAGWLEAGLRALETADMVGGRVEVAVADPAALTDAEAFELVFAFNNERYIREEKFSVTANMFVPRDVFDRVGGFRPQVSEDVDWGRRAAAFGFRWAYAPEARVGHPARRTNDELVRKWRRITAESLALARDSRGGRTWWLARNWLALLALPVLARRAWTSRQLSRPADRVKALRVLVWGRVWRFREAHRLLLPRRSPPPRLRSGLP